MIDADLLSRIAAAGIKLRLDGDAVRFSAPKGALTPELRDELKARKDDLRDFLRRTAAGDGDAPAPEPPIARAPRDRDLPLSFAQQRLWVVERLDPGQRIYHLPSALRLRGALDERALRAALGEIVRRHEALRTTFAERDGSAHQIVHPAPAAWPLDVVDLTFLPEGERVAAATERAVAEAALPFDLGAGPLLRTTLYRLGPDDHVLLVTMHHIIADAWSVGVMVQEVAALYEAEKAGRPSPLPELAIQYADVAVWQRHRLAGEGLTGQVEHWKLRLAGAPTLTLPTDHPRPPLPSTRGARHPVAIPRELTSALRELGRRHNATLFMTLMAAFQVLLSRHAGQDDVCVGTPVANRNRAELEPLIGFFVNTLVLRCDLGDNPSFLDHLARVRQDALEAYSNQDLPFEGVIEALGVGRDLDRRPLAQVIFALQNAPMGGLALGGLTIEPLAVELHTTKFELEMSLFEEDGGLSGVLEYSTDLFEEATITRMVERYRVLLRAIVAEPSRRVGDLPLLTEVERATQLALWNDTRAELPPQRTMHALFEAQVDRTPRATAVVCGAERLDYEELNRRANRLAHHLRGLGVGPETLVGVCLPRSIDLPVALLGVLKAGGAYLPVDPSYPAERVAVMLESSGAPLILTTTQLEGLTRTARARVLCLDAEHEAIDRHGPENPPASATGDNLAYVIFTSGSTGVPRGIWIVHRGAVNYLAWASRAYPAEDGAPVHSSIAFDLTVTSLFGPLVVGGRVVLLPEEDAVESLAAALVDEDPELGVVKITPAHVGLLAHHLQATGGRARAKALVIGGEQLLATAVDAWRAVCPDTVVFNEYGPTETVVGSTVYRVAPEDSPTGAVPIGRPIANTQVYILDRRLQPTPIGVPGELYIGGAGLARGYLNRPALTAESFVPSPFASAPGERLYRTGDLARWLPAGDLEFLGRRDGQTKLRGYRIELGEIEAALEAHPDVAQGVAVVREDQPGDRRLVAYVVAQEEAEISSTALRMHLQQLLPSYMLPSAFVVLGAVPLTPNGKVDRAALPPPSADRAASGSEYVAPRTPIEERLAAIFCQVLRAGQIGVHDNFFEAGGDSILTVQVVARAQQAGLALTPRQVFQHPTIARLAQAVIEAPAPAAAPPERAAEGPAPLTPIQRWFLAQEQPAPHHYNQAVLVSVDAAVDPAALERSLGVVVAHHEALSLRFSHEGGAWQQQRAAEAQAVSLLRVDLAGLSAEDQPRALERAAAEIQASLDLSRGPLLRAAWFDLGAAGRRLLVVAHHLVVDALSWHVLLGDLTHAHARIAAGEEVDLPPATTSFRRWAELLHEHARGDALARQLDLWLDRPWGDVRPLPVDRPAGNNTYSSMDTVRTALGAEPTAALLRRVPEAYHCRVHDALLTALAQALADLAGGRVVLVDVEGHGREPLFEGVSLARTVGWFTSLFPVVLEVDPTGSPGAALRAIKERLRAVPDGGIGHGLLRYAGDPEIAARLAALPRAEVCFNYLGQQDGALDEASPFRPAPESSGPAQAPQNRRAYLIDISAAITAGQLHCDWSFSADVHDRDTVAALAERFLSRLSALIAHCLSPDAGGYTPSDFPLARLSPAALDRIAGNGRGVEDVYRLSPMQQGMLLHTLRDRGSSAYFNQLLCRLDGALDAAAFAEAWQHAVDRYPVLRTSFHWEGLDEPVQVVHRRAALEVAREDWRALPPASQRERLEARLEEDRRRGFDLTAPPLMRLLLIRVEDRAHELVWSHHHLVTDGWSMPLLLESVLAIYAALGRGETPQLTPTRPYRDYIAWLEGRNLTEAEAYFRQQLRGITAPTPLPLARAAAPAGESRDREVQTRLGAHATAALGAAARRRGLTQSTLVQGAWALLLGRYGGVSTVVFGVTMSGRPAALAGVDSMVGLFINTLPVRVELPPGEPVSAWLGRLQEQLVELRQHEHAPLALVQGYAETPPGQPLFDSLVVFENYPVGEALPQALHDLHIGDVRAVEQTSYPLTVVAAPGRELTLKLGHDAARVDDAAAAQILGHLRALLEAMAADLDQPLAALPMLGEPELRRMLVEWNATSEGLPQEDCIQTLFEAQASRSPDATAVVSGDVRLTYRELDHGSNRLARHLRDLGVGPGKRVGLLLPRCPELIVAMLAALKVGAAYVPLDPSHPRERLEYMLRDADARVLVAEEALARSFPALDARVLTLPDLRAALAGGSAEPLPRRTRGGDVAYVIYTSGSTGTPKGVCVEHRGLVNLVLWHLRAHGLGPADRCAQIASPGFDASVWEIWPPLAAGASLFLIDDETRMSPRAVVNELTTRGITVTFLPTPLTEAVLLEEWPQESALRKMLTGGDRLRRRPGQGRPFRLVNHYGPTECTVVATAGDVEPEGEGAPSIGRPISNTSVYVLDATLSPVPAGVAGELHIGGAGVARGYLDRRALTAERFVPDPFGAAPGARMYRTGDLVKWLPDGRLEFLGRADHQVKIRGHRVELGEIEAPISSRPGVQQAVVLAPEDERGDLRLVAYVVPEDPASRSMEALRAHLEEVLPAHMVPSAFVVLDALPLSPTGKVDRAALLARGDATGAAEHGLAAPRTPVEEIIAGVFSDVLGGRRAGADDSFFALGGHSLLATQVVSRLRATFDVELPLRALFEAPTPAALAARVEEARRDGAAPHAPALVPLPRDGDPPLSFAQQRLWFLDQLAPDSALYNVPTALRLKGALDTGALQGALDELVRRHEALRTTFPARGGEPVQRIQPPSPAHLHAVDLRDLPEEGRSAEALRLAALSAQEPFDLASGPLLRALLLHIADGEHLLVLTLHHIVSDGWSMGILVRELGASYTALRDGAPAPLPELPVQYADFARWQRAWLTGDALQAQLDHWRRVLHAAPVLELPTDHPRPAVLSHRGATLPFSLPHDLSEALLHLGQRHGATLFMTVLAAYFVLLSRHSGQKDLCVGTPVANRHHRELEPLIGFFVNTLVLRADLTGDPSFLDLLARVRTSALDAHAHQDIPFEQLVLALGVPRDLGRTPLFQAMLVLQNTPVQPLELPGLALEPVALDTGAAQFDLTLSMGESEGGLVGSFAYNAELFEPETIARMARRFEALLRGLCAHPERPVSEAPMLDSAERRTLLAEWGGADIAAPAEGTFLDLFDAQVQRAPEAIAVVFDDESVTYAELARRARQLAWHLRGLGVGPDRRVGLCVPRSVDMIVGLLGILEAGGAYVPLDPDYPPERLEYMTRDAGATLLVTRGRDAEQRISHAGPTVRLDEDGPEIARCPDTRVPAGIGPHDLAYVIYTSGSTGRPKGVLLHHLGLRHLCRAQAEIFGVTPADRVLQFASLSFDASIFEVALALPQGATLVLSRRETVASPVDLRRLLVDQRVTVATLPPSMLHLLPPVDPSLRLVISAGEPCTSSILATWGAGRALINAYGPTESTVWATYERCDASRPGDPPIGRPVPGTSAYVLDAARTPVPPGVRGELWLGGAGLARGYLGRAGLTAERFVPDPFSPSPGARMYRTGDLATWLPDGRLALFGRTDHQVKIRGHRIELGEIEAAVASYSGVNQAVVVAREDTPGDLRLVAYVVPDGGAPPPAAPALRRHLGETLPAFMVPAAFVVLETLPLSPTGKVDRAALPAPEASREGLGTEYAAPRSPTEEIIAGVFQEVLGARRAGADDDFFALGGHSLLATQVISRLRGTFDVELPLRALFEAPTPAALAARVEEARRAGRAPHAPALVPLPRDGDLPLSFAQQRLWFLDQLAPGGTHYHMPVALRLRGALDTGALQGALDELVRRHEALRTTFPARGGEPVQRILPPSPAHLHAVDLRALPEEGRSAEALRLAALSAQEPFDLASGPLLRALLLHIADGEHLLVLTLHHIVSDGWSMGILVRELGASYTALRDGAPAPLPDLPVQYADFARWQRAWLTGDALQAQLDHWRRVLHAAPVLELPTDHPRPAVLSHRGATLPFSLPHDLSSALLHLGQRHGATLFMTVLAAYFVLLSRHSGQKDLCVGTPVANRHHRELEPLIGFFVNTLVLRADLTGDPSFLDLLARVRTSALDAHAHQDIPFEQLVLALGVPRDLGRTPLFQAMLVLQNTPVQTLELPGLALEPVTLDTGAAKFDLTLSIGEQDGRISGSFAYDAALFEPETIARMARRFEVLLRGLCAHPERPVSEAPMLDSAERRTLLAEWNGARGPIPEDTCIQTLFEAAARRSPEATAVVFEGEQLTYAELAGRARQLAWHLRSLGVGPEKRVGLCVPRSVDMIVGLLGILEAGGAYVPLDPEHPPDRLAFLVEDAGLTIIVTLAHLAPGLPGAPVAGAELAGAPVAGAVRLLRLDADWATIARSSPPGEALRVTPDNLAYVLYTSGSTGRPKGVMVQHRSVVNLHGALREAVYGGLGEGPLRVGLNAPLVFDSSIKQLLALLDGHTLEILSDPVRQSPGALLARLRERPLDVLDCTPSLLQVWLDDALGEHPPHLPRRLLVGGEALGEALRARLAAIPHLDAYNVYGPTECTVDATACQVRGAASGASIGRPLRNMSVHVLDRRLEPTPVGVAGELCIGGAGVGRGYVGQPGLTAERFVPDPFGEEPGARMYRTGDLARWRHDGQLEFLGRLDHQVKVRGYRIELGEIEAVLTAHPDVRAAVVLAREDSPGDRRLVAYVVPASEASPSPSALQRHLAAALPRYMVPSAFVRMEALPRTPNGKLDRGALPAPEAPAHEGAGHAFVAPRTPVEEIVAAGIQEVLGLERVGVHDDFFALGGHSLLATRVISRLRSAFSVELPLRVLFEAPTVAGLAARVLALRHEGPTAALPPLEKAPRGEDLPLSFAQQRLWFLDQLDPGSPAYNIPSALHLRGALRPGALRGALDELVRRHESLRTTFPDREGVPSQRVHPPAPFALRLVDLSGTPAGERWAEALRLAAEEAEAPFDLAAGPLARGALFSLGEGDHVLSLTMHHIVSDGWSMGVLVRELGVLYAAFCEERPSPLPELAVQYADFARWQRAWLVGPALSEQVDHWRRRLAGAPALELPADRPRPPVQGRRGGLVPVALPAELSSGLARLGQRRGATLFMVILAAFHTLLSRSSGQADTCVGTPVANRRHADLEPLIGFFVNTLVMRADVSDDPPFLDLLARVRDSALDAYTHQDVPFEQVVDALDLPRDPSRTPLFQAMLVLQSAGEGGLSLPGLSLAPLPAETAAAKFDLTLSLTEHPGGLQGAFSFDAGLFDAETIARMATHFEALLRGICADPGQRVSALPMLDEAERGRLLALGTGAALDIPPGATVHRLFEQQAARSPEALAVVSDTASLTYGELDRRANQLAWHLRSLGVGPEARVGLFAERCPEMVVAVLAILKAGAAYVPLDPDYPPERLDFMRSDAAVAAVVTHAALAPRLAHGPVPVIVVDADADTLSSYPTSAPPTDAGPDHVAYVMYTSGSTGRPKGVLVPHRAVVRLACSGRHARLTAADTTLQLAPLSFDAATFELWATLLAGATVALAPPGVLALEDIGTALARHRVTALWLTAPLFHQMVDRRLGDLAGLRHLLAGGDVLSPRHVEAALAALPHCQLWNGYGPTENTTFTTCAALRDHHHPGRPAPIGTPLDATRVYLLDHTLSPVPTGAPGRLYTAGDGLARGYLGRPALTAERFVPDPFSPEPGARMYFTGDLARFRPDGQLEFLGRADQQVKIRGFRIEPSEIEAVLAACPGVHQVAVVVHDEPAAGKRLVAHVVPDSHASLSVEQLRKHLLERLPSFMVPSAFVLRDALPLSPAGKIDRRALPAPEISREGLATEYAAPRTPTEEIIAGVFQEVLGTRAGADDDFFALGGHSLLATQVISRLRATFDVELPLRALFEAPTPAALAARVEEARRDGAAPHAPALVPLPRDGDPPLSFAQQRLWFLDQLAPGSALYNIPTALRLKGALDTGALQGALDELVRRHEALRTTFPARGGEPVQRIQTPSPAHLHAVDLRDLPEEGRSAEALRLAALSAQEPFDLASGPLLRALLLHIADGEHLLVLTLHHIVSDGWSMGILVRELGASYTALRDGAPAPLPDLPVQYADFARWQRAWLTGDALQAQLDHWRRVLHAAPVLELPTDHPRPAVLSHRGATLPFSLPRDVTDALLHLGQRHGATLFMTVLAAYFVLLSRHSGQKDLCVGTPVANRHHRELEPLIGFFVNTLVLRADLADDPSFLDLLARVRTSALDAHAHQDIPFEQLVLALDVPRDLGRTPLFQAMLVLQNTPVQSLELPGLALEPVALDTGAAKLDLTLFLAEREGGLTCGFTYDAELFEAETIARMARRFEVLLRGLCAHPERPVSEAPMLDSAERTAVLAAAQGAIVDFPGDTPIHALFEAAARRTPEATAVVFEGESLTYAELDRRADQLAHHLRPMGVGPDVIVAICLPASLAIVVALLGVLKAGGAYLPVDPGLPAERLSYLLTSSGAAAVLTERAFAGPVVGVGIPTVCLDEAQGEIDRAAAPPVAARVTGRNLAYVLYTSGSTGLPKGVGVEHRQLVHYTTAISRMLDVPAGASFAVVSTFSADLGNTMLFPSLCGGGCLHVVARDRVTDPERLAEYMESREVDCLKIVPSHLAALLTSARPERLLPRRRLVLGGEAAGRELVETIRRLAPGCVVFNHYGPTETTVGVIAGRLDPDAGSRGSAVPLGKPIANTRIYLLGSDLSPVPDGIPGEVFIGGEGVSRGYLGQPGLTAERFVPDPFRGEPGARLYRSGDWARRLPDGDIVFLGRVDDQVKIRGFRVELREIEATLTSVPGVRQAVVLAPAGRGGERSLVAYVVLNTESGLSGEALRARLAARLPEAMIPQEIVLLDALPLTPNGKVDRGALPSPGPARGVDTSTFVAPRSRLELELAGLWEELLGVRPVGARDDFFRLGGHSLLAVRLVARIQARYGRSLPLARLFRRATVEAVAAALSGDASGASSPLVALRSGGSQAPFFCVHAVDGSALAYLDVAAHMGEDRPFHAAHARGLDADEEPCARVEEMAERYLAAAREIQPRGPYHLGGWSFGGLVAFEMAQRLIEAGEEVGTLVLIDTWARPPEPERRPDELSLLIEMARELRWPVSPETLAALSPDERLERIAELAVAAGALPPELGLAHVRRLVRVHRAHLDAARAYSPRLYSGKLTLLCAETPSSASIRAAALRDPTYGWGEFSEHPVERRVVPGDHSSMVRSPHAGALARALLDVLAGDHR